MTSEVVEAVVLLVSGVVGGAIGGAGGITSLITYPALLAVGVPALPASATNLVAFVACWPGSALTSRRELRMVSRVVRLALPVAACGAAVGAVLLLDTPPGAFSRIVPFLIVLGSGAMLGQPWLTERLSRNGHRVSAVAWPLIALVSVYSGYFGAGSGVLVLAVLLVLIERRLPEANAIKNMLAGGAAAVSAAIFVLVGRVDWNAVTALAAGLFVGSTAGPVIARRLPSSAVRCVSAALGVALAIKLWINPP